MLDIIKTATNYNGPDYVSGRGLARRKLTSQQRIDLAANLATGRQYLAPSLAQITNLTGISLLQLRSALKARARRDAEQQEAERREQAQLEAETANAQAAAVIAAWDSASPLAREAAIRGIGVAHVWEVLADIVA
jgi:hypothetical protein